MCCVDCLSVLVSVTLSKAVTVQHKSHPLSPQSDTRIPPLPLQNQQLISVVEHMVILIYLISVRSD